MYLADRIKDSLAALALKVSPYNCDDYNYFWDILMVARRVKAISVNNALNNHLNKGLFKQKFGRGQDLHYCILDTLADQGIIQSEYYAIAIRDLENIDYVDAAFKVLYGQDLKWWKLHFPQVVKTITVSHQPIILRFVLEQLLESLTLKVFIRELPEILPELTNNFGCRLIIDTLCQLYPNREMEIIDLLYRELLFQEFEIDVPGIKEGLNKGINEVATILKNGLVFTTIDNPYFVKMVDSLQRSGEVKTHWPESLAEARSVIRTQINVN